MSLLEHLRGPAELLVLQNGAAEILRDVEAQPEDQGEAYNAKEK